MSSLVKAAREKPTEDNDRINLCVGISVETAENSVYIFSIYFIFYRSTYFPTIFLPVYIFLSINIWGILAISTYVTLNGKYEKIHVRKSYIHMSAWQLPSHLIILLSCVIYRANNKVCDTYFAKLFYDIRTISLTKSLCKYTSYRKVISRTYRCNFLTSNVIG